MKYLYKLTFLTTAIGRLFPFLNYSLTSALGRFKPFTDIKFMASIGTIEPDSVIESGSFSMNKLLTVSGKYHMTVNTAL